MISYTKNGFRYNIVKSSILNKLATGLLIKDRKLRYTNLKYELFDHTPGLNIVYTSRQFQLYNESFDDKRYVFIGASVAGRLQECNIPFGKMKKAGCLCLTGNRFDLP